MIQWLYKILFVSITFSFFLSATEIDLGKSHNTFFDEYDTYICAEHIAFDNATSLPDYNSNVSALPFFINFYGVPVHLFSFIHTRTLYLNHYPAKLYLRNSVWRI
jgi:hypothetical protein